MMKTVQSITHAGLQKTGAVDYPGLLSSVIFLPGCNMRCPYCHNPNLVTEIDKTTLIPIDDIFLFLKKRSGIIRGVVISGGEPLIYPLAEIDELITKIQNMGFRVKLDTNGTFPEKLSQLTPDFIAMDIKTIPSRYSELMDKNSIKKAAEKQPGEKIKESIQWIISSGIQYEFRTTVAPDFFKEKELDQIIPLLKGASQWSLTPFRQGETIDPLWQTKLPPEREILIHYKKKIEDAGIPCTLRN